MGFYLIVPVHRKVNRMTGVWPQNQGMLEEMLEEAKSLVTEMGYLHMYSVSGDRAFKEQIMFYQHYVEGELREVKIITREIGGKPSIDIKGTTEADVRRVVAAWMQMEVVINALELLLLPGIAMPMIAVVIKALQIVGFDGERMGPTKDSVYTLQGRLGTVQVHVLLDEDEDRHQLRIEFSSGLISSIVEELLGYIPADLSVA